MRLFIEVRQSWLNGLPDRRKKMVRRSMDGVHLGRGAAMKRGNAFVRLYSFHNIDKDDARRLIESIAYLHNKDESSELDDVMDIIEGSGVDPDSDIARLMMKCYRIGRREEVKRAKPVLNSVEDANDFISGLGIPDNTIAIHATRPTELNPRDED